MQYQLNSLASSHLLLVWAVSDAVCAPRHSSEPVFPLVLAPAFGVHSTVISGVHSAQYPV